MNALWKSIFISLKEYIRKDLKINKEKALKHNIWGTRILKNNSNKRVTLAKVRSLEENGILPVELLNIQPKEIKIRDIDDICSTYTQLKRCHVKHALEALSNFIKDVNLNLINNSYQTPCRTYIQENIHKFKKGSGWWVKSLKYNECILKNVRIREEKWRWRLNNDALDRNFWDTQYKMIQKIKFDNKIQITQFQIMKGNLRTNNIVHKFKPVEVPEECTFGCNTKETINHLFYTCPTSQHLIRQVNIHLPSWTEGKDYVDIVDFLFISKMKRLSIREITKLMVKYYIWRSRCAKNKDDMSIEKFKAYLYNYMRPHKKAQSLDFLKDENVWKDLKAAEI